MGLSLFRFEPLRCPVLSLGGWNEAARIYQSNCEVGGSLAACGTSAAGHGSCDRIYRHRVARAVRRTGFVEGQNVAVEYRWAQGRYDRLPELAAELVRQQVAVIAATGGEPSPQSAMGATQTIPIVFTAAGDPVRAGLVASLNRPGGNATGITISGDPAVTKRMQLMHELLPQVASITYLMDPKNPNGEA